MLRVGIQPRLDYSADCSDEDSSDSKFVVQPQFLILSTDNLCVEQNLRLIIIRLCNQLGAWDAR